MFVSRQEMKGQKKQVRPEDETAKSELTDAVTARFV